MSLELALFQDDGYDRGRPWKEPDLWCLSSCLYAHLHVCWLVSDRRPFRFVDLDKETLP